MSDSTKGKHEYCFSDFPSTAFKLRYTITDCLLPLLVAFASSEVAFKSIWRPKRHLQLGEIEKCGQGLKIMGNAAHAFLYVLQIIKTRMCVCVCV